MVRFNALPVDAGRFAVGGGWLVFGGGLPFVEEAGTLPVFSQEAHGVFGVVLAVVAGGVVGYPDGGAFAFGGGEPGPFGSCFSFAEPFAVAAGVGLPPRLKGRLLVRGQGISSGFGFFR